MRALFLLSGGALVEFEREAASPAAEKREFSVELPGGQSVNPGRKLRRRDWQAKAPAPELAQLSRNVETPGAGWKAGCSQDWLPHKKSPEEPVRLWWFGALVGL
jgi:hypothetical protein